MRRGAGPGRTRDDHLELAAQLVALLAKARDVRELTELLGGGRALPDRSRLPAIRGRVQRGFVNQGLHDSRTLDDTLTRAWAVACLLPRRELTMLSADMLDAHYHPNPPQPPT